MAASKASRTIASHSLRWRLHAPPVFAESRFTSMPVARAFSWKSIFSKMCPLFGAGGWVAKGVVKAEVARPSQEFAQQRLTSASKCAHIYFLLDRSGSMQMIADDVIGGFNAFVTEQQRESSDSAGLDMTMVQFDSKNPQEILFAARDIGAVPFLCTRTFQPRGATPLFDAIGGIISMAEETEKSQNAGKQIVVVTFSDGMENASQEYSKACVFSRIDAKQKEGWTFVFLGANQDSYGEGGKLGFKGSNTQNFAFDSKGTQKAWEAVSGATRVMRQKLRPQSADSDAYSNENFFDGVKLAEDDYESRKSKKGA